MGLVDKSHGGVVAPDIGVEFTGHDASAGCQRKRAHLIVKAEKMPVGFFLVAGAHMFNFAEEVGGKPLDTTFEAETVDFLAQGTAGYVAGNEEEQVALVVFRELAKGLEGRADPGIAEPENTRVFQDRTPGNFELKIVNSDLRENLGVVQNDHAFII